MADAIKQALALAEKVVPPEGQEIDPAVLKQEEEVTQLNLEIVQLQKLQEQMKGEVFGVEAMALERIKARCDNLKQKVVGLKNEILVARRWFTRREQIRTRIEFLGPRFPRLSWEPLAWRDSSGFPRLAIFGMKSSHFVLRIDSDGDSNKFAFAKLQECYGDVIELLRSMRTRYGGVELKCQFEGLIPPEVRQQIREAEDVFGKHIYIIAEPGKFQLNEVAAIRRGDPLVVGYDEVTNSLWLIAAFDTTDVETAMFLCLPK